MINQPTIEHLIDEMTVQKQKKLQVNKLTRQLIHKLEIPYCGNLYFHLGLGNKCDNHTAVNQWVSETFNDIDTGDFDDNYRILREQLLEIDTANA